MIEETLEALVDRVRRSERFDRIELRDPVVAYGDAAIDVMADWLDDREFAAFAVRVLERIGRDPEHRAAVIKALVEALPESPSDAIQSDINAALENLGRGVLRPSLRRSRAEVPPPVGIPGRLGRRYWAMRTSISRPDFIWAEARRGRLRQGWGWEEEQDLRRIAARAKQGAELTQVERMAWRARRMLGTEHDGVRYDDYVVTQNLPRHAHISVFRVVGPYEFDVPNEPRDYGHILPTELLVEDISRHDARVSDALRHAIRLRPRLYEITPYGGDVERLVSTAGSRDR